MDLGQMVVRIVGDNTQFKSIVDDSEKSFKKMNVAAAAMAAAVAAAFVKMVNDATQYGSAIFDAAQKTGLSTDAIQKWKYIAEQTGTTLETVTGAVAQMTRNLDVNEKKFAQLGVTLKNQDGTFRSVTAIFNDTIMKLASMKDATARDALTFDLLGRSAQNMIPIIKEGEAGLKKLEDRAKSLGIIVKESAINNTEALGDAFNTLKNAAKAAATNLVGDLAPALTKTVDGATELLHATAGAGNGASKLKEEIKSLQKTMMGPGLKAFQVQADMAGVAMDQFIGTVQSGIEAVKAATNETENAWDRLLAKINKDAQEWDDVVSTLANSMSSALGGAFEAIGGALAEDKDAWKNWGKLALRAVADILRALAAQLAAFVALNLAKIPPSFGKAATAAAGAAAALVAAGAVDAYAGQLADGGIVKPRAGGVAAVVAEAGEAEAVIPLSKLDSMLAGRGLSDESGGMTHLTVQLDSRPILDKIFSATKNKTVLISAGAVV